MATVKELEALIKQYLEERGWDKLRPSDLAKSVSIEAGELLELFQWSHDDLQTVKQDKEKLEQIKKELADVLIYCLDMSVLLELDTEAVVRAKLEHIAKKYPPELMKKAQATEEPGTHQAYWNIKKEYRKKGL
jgi:NTP pyrophosphatase (non-canonical NTP hydrolase)